MLDRESYIEKHNIDIEDGSCIRIGVDKEFITVSDGWNEFFGGRQEWFPEEYRPDIHKYGCGIVAAVNVYLYLAGITRISKIGYMTLVSEFLQRFPSSGILLNTGLGVFPWQMSAFIRKKCEAASIKVYPDWKGRGGVNNLYFKMKEALENNTPVIWAFYNMNPSHKLQFYRYVNGEFKDTFMDSQSMEHRYDGVNSHYVTVTAVYETKHEESLERWVEISSWGSKYYVNYDEYENFVRNHGGIFNPVNLINAYCSNILIVERR